jgi:hypothetical protein
VGEEDNFGRRGRDSPVAFFLRLSFDLPPLAARCRQSISPWRTVVSADFEMLPFLKMPIFQLLKKFQITLNV